MTAINSLKTRILIATIFLFKSCVSIRPLLYNNLTLLWKINKELKENDENQPNRKKKSVFKENNKLKNVIILKTNSFHLIILDNLFMFLIWL